MCVTGICPLGVDRRRRRSGRRGRRRRRWRGTGRRADVHLKVWRVKGVCGWAGEGNRRRGHCMGSWLAGEATRTARRRQRADTLSPTHPPAKIADGNSPSRHGHSHHTPPVTPRALALTNISSPFSPRTGLHTSEYGVLRHPPIFLSKHLLQNVPKRPYSTSMTRFGVPRARFKTRHPGCNQQKSIKHQDGG